MNTPASMEGSAVAWGKGMQTGVINAAEKFSPNGLSPINPAIPAEDAAEFVATVVHDLNTPLNVASGFARVLLQGMAGPLTDEQKEIVATIVASLTQSQVLVQDLLCFGQLRHGNVSMDYAPIDLCSVVCDTVAQLQIVAQAADVRLEGQGIYGPPCIVMGSRLRLEQCLHNLISNAIRFSYKGGTVLVSLEIGDDYHVTVEDHGIGIAPEHQALIFQRHYQVAKGPARAAKGNGLGLSISRNLIEQHGGRIGVVSSPDAGSRFWFSLPRADAEAATLAS